MERKVRVVNVRRLHGAGEGSFRQPANFGEFATKVGNPSHHNRVGSNGMAVLHPTSRLGPSSRSATTAAAVRTHVKTNAQLPGVREVFRLSGGSSHF